MKFAAILIASLVAMPTVASYCQAPAKPTKTLRYLKAADLDPAKILPPPAADGSAAQLHELAEVKRLVETRTKERMEQARWDNVHENPSAWDAVLGPEFDLKKLPATAKLLADVMNDQDAAADLAKSYFKRKAPVAAAMPSNYAEWSCSEPRTPESRAARSYPSGHVTMGYSVGMILASLIPEKAQAILARSADYAYSREVCGDHYHSDAEAGHVLGTAVAELTLHSETLKPELEAARQELRRAGITK